MYYGNKIKTSQNIPISILMKNKIIRAILNYIPFLFIYTEVKMVFGL
jgi:hypothetical protein